MPALEQAAHLGQPALGQEDVQSNASSQHASEDAS
jgi:hypothetical protein